MKRVNISLLCAGLTLTACGHTQTYPGSTIIKREGVFSAWTTTLHDKGDKFDFKLNVRNDSDKTLLVLLHDIHCARGERPGVIKHAFFGAGERDIDLKPGQTKDLGLVCEIGGKFHGDFSIKIASVYDNPSNDGTTAGEKVADNIEIRYVAKSAK